VIGKSVTHSSLRRDAEPSDGRSSLSHAELPFGSGYFKKYPTDKKEIRITMSSAFVTKKAKDIVIIWDFLKSLLIFSVIVVYKQEKFSRRIIK
jgi:hypothetical protein